jgi:hypothetical protein
LVARIADSSSKNAVSFSSERTTNRFPLSRCASAIQIVRPSESIAETQPQPSGFAEIVGYGFAFDGLRLRWPIYAEYQRKLGVIRFALCFIGLRPT